MGALTSLHVGQNNILAEEMRKTMAVTIHMDNMKILCEVPFKDKTLTELDVSGKQLGMEGALVVAGYLDSNGALLKISLEAIPTQELGMALHVPRSPQSLPHLRWA
jgi:hypothetical protein